MIRFIKTTQKVNSLSGQNGGTTFCAKLYHSIMLRDAAHGWKAYWVYFHTQQIVHHLDFSLGSYNSISGNCSRNWQPCEDSWKYISWKLVHIDYPVFSFSCLYLSRRVVPSINIHVLLSKRRLLIIEIQNPPFVQLCANKYWEWSLSLCSCDFLREIYRSGGFIRSQLVLLLPSRFTLIDYRLCWLVSWECGWTNPQFRLPVKDGGWL